jgi:hypothetical protein
MLPRGAELAAYTVLSGHCDAAWKTYPSLTLIAELGHLNIGSAVRAINALQRYGLIVLVERGGGSGNTNTYRIVDDPDEVRNIRAGAHETPSETCAQPARKHARSGAETCAPQAEKHTRRRAPKREGREIREQQQEGTLPAAAGLRAVEPEQAAAGPDPDPDVLAALEARGITGRSAAELAARPDITAELVKRAVAEAHRRGAANPAGLVVTMLRAGDDLPPTPAELADQQQAEQNHRQARRAAELAEQARRQQADDDATLAGLTIAEIHELAQQVRDGKTSLNMADRQRLRDADPMAHAELRHHIAKRYAIHGLGQTTTATSRRRRATQ